jgi:hypothetical protein
LTNPLEQSWSTLSTLIGMYFLNETTNWNGYSP